MRKKSAKKAAQAFKDNTDEIMQFLAPQNLSKLSERHTTWAYEYAIIRLYREFEDLILNSLIAAINNDTKELSKKTGVDFPKHLTDEVCEYIILGDGYFDFRGKGGLVKTLKSFLPDDHYLVEAVKRDTFNDALNRLSALRNFSAHDSRPSKKRALEAISLTQISSSGAWLKKQQRFEVIAESLKLLAQEIHNNAPY